MERHWVIVRRDRPELFHALSLAFMRRRGYVVVLDRRVASRRGSERRDRQERRVRLADVEPFAIVEGATSTEQYASGR